MRIAGSTKGIALVALAAAAAALALAAGALAVFPNDSVTHYAGCLNTNASPGGTFVNIAVGETPSKPCGNGQVLVHVSGGDITNVATAAGSGLSGGTDNGAASLALNSNGCTSGGVLKWNGTAWACGSDNNSTYGNGTGLDLSAGNVFSVDSAYQLPQNCTNGQVAKSNGSNSWACQDDSVGGTEVFSDANNDAQEIPRPNGGVGANYGENVTIAEKFLPPGTYALVATTQLLDFDNDAGYICDLEDNTGTQLDFASVATQGYGLTDIHAEIKPNRAPVALSAVYTQAAPGAKVEFRCKADTDGGATASWTKLTAIKIATLH